jgi:hypothetical protein
MDSRFNVFDPRFVELDCGDCGAPVVVHLQRPVKSSPVGESSQVKSSQVEWSGVELRDFSCLFIKNGLIFLRPVRN